MGGLECGLSVDQDGGWPDEPRSARGRSYSVGYSAYCACLILVRLASQLRRRFGAVVPCVARPGHLDPQIGGDCLCVSNMRGRSIRTDRSQAVRDCRSRALGPD